MTQQAQTSQNTNAEKVVRTCFGAYPARDRAAIESVMAEDFRSRIVAFEMKAFFPLGARDRD